MINNIILAMPYLPPRTTAAILALRANIAPRNVNKQASSFILVIREFISMTSF